MPSTSRGLLAWTTRSLAAAAILVVARMALPTKSTIANGAGSTLTRSRKQLRQVLRQMFCGFQKNRVLAVAAGVAFYCLLAVFPALTVLVSIYSLFADRSQISNHVGAAAAWLPQAAAPLITDQVARVAGQPPARSIVLLTGGLIVSLWSANSGVKAMLEALNVARECPEQRSFIRLNTISLALTAAAIGGFLLLIAAIAVIPAVLAFFPLSEDISVLLDAGRWPLAFAFLLAGISILYRYGPSGADRRRWLSPGGMLASTGILVFSMAFSWYAANFGNYNQTYGALGAAIAFMTWLWLAATITLIGAELDMALGRKT